MQPIFVKTRTHYYTCDDPNCDKKHSQSYTDYWRLVELAEFPVVYVDQIDWQSDNVYIYSPANGEFPEKAPDNKKCTIIHWCLERPHEGMTVDKRFDRTWVSDRYFASILVDSKYLPLGTDYRLREGDIDFPKKWDFIHLSYLTDRRKRVIDYLESQGYKIAPNSWGLDRHINLMQSKAMLAIHQDEWPIIEPLRYALASAYHLPILAEYSKDFYPWVIHQEMPAPVNLIWLKPKFPLDQDYQFKDCVLKALEDI